MTIDALKQAALDHLKDRSAASFLEPLEDGLWLCVGTKESIAELVGPEQGAPAGGVTYSKKDVNKLLNDFAKACTFGDDMLARMQAAKAIHEYLDVTFAAALATPPQAKEE